MSTAIKRLRERTGRTQEALARDVGVSLSTVRLWESGALPSLRHWRALVSLGLRRRTLLRWAAKAAQL